MILLCLQNICNLYINLGDERDIAAYCMDPAGLNWSTFRQDEDWWKTYDYSVGLRQRHGRERGHFRGDMEREGRRRQARVDDRSVRFRNEDHASFRSRSRDYGRRNMDSGDADAKEEV